ncbi:hypothetical protein SAMN05444972_10825 [Marininema halotolerans]|uniref:Uncharacterized protein n=1 Tax=Marininema halotolerans TaxID=1155944 RepID=A0A1I6STA1_9BACL|nr:hypothetical protein SAMN05444972_10825 [Marininema halotolerans]
MILRNGILIKPPRKRTNKNRRIGHKYKCSTTKLTDTSATRIENPIGKTCLQIHGRFRILFDKRNPFRYRSKYNEYFPSSLHMILFVNAIRGILI